MKSNASLIPSFHPHAFCLPHILTNNYLIYKALLPSPLLDYSNLIQASKALAPIIIRGFSFLVTQRQPLVLSLLDFTLLFACSDYKAQGILIYETFQHSPSLELQLPNQHLPFRLNTATTTNTLTLLPSSESLLAHEHLY